MNPVGLRKDTAFTLIELLVVVAILGITLAMFLPIMDRGCRTPARQIGCMNNLKQTGLGWMLYAADHADQFPWQISTHSTATAALVESYPAHEFFRALTNYALPPSKFVCPSDETRSSATNYLTFNNSNLSYFAALSSSMTSSNVSRLIFAGDRHLSADGQPAGTGLFTLKGNSIPGWTKELHKTGSKAAQGGLLFVDGHVEFSITRTLPRIFKDQAIITTRLVIP